jgi:WS/DGAT/MGAT family acyltransferase
MVLPDLSGDSDSDSPQLEAPRTRLNVAIDGRRNFDGRSYDLEMIKAARGLVSGATVNDVVVAGIGGALRRYLLGLDDLPEDSLVGLMPISLHADPKMEGGNRITIARVPLGTHIEDPAERLGEVHEATSRSKEVSQGAGAGSLVEFSELLPGALVTMAVRVSQSLNLVERVPVVGGNTLVSNIPGPRKPIYFAGARMVSEYGVPPILDGGTLANVITSYCGRVFVSLGSSPKVMPDIEHYGDCVDQSFAEYTGRSKKSQNRRTASRA